VQHLATVAHFVVGYALVRANRVIGCLEIVRDLMLPMQTKEEQYYYKHVASDRKSQRVNTYSGIHVCREKTVGIDDQIVEQNAYRWFWIRIDQASEPFGLANRAVERVVDDSRAVCVLHSWLVCTLSTVAELRHLLMAINPKRW
jgi:hypothetical protein